MEINENKSKKNSYMTLNKLSLLIVKVSKNNSHQQFNNQEYSNNLNQQEFL